MNASFYVFRCSHYYLNEAVTMSRTSISFLYVLLTHFISFKYNFEYDLKYEQFVIIIINWLVEN